MTTGMSPRNMLIAGIVLILLNVAALAPMATGAVEGAVEDNFESFTKDSVCADADCTEAEEDWASSTSPRDFYGYSITNVADVMANGTAPTYERIGPVTYDITTTRTILDYDSAAGELTYNSVKSFACSADTEVPCDTEVSQLNIAFQTQVIGATGTGHQRHHGRMTKAAFSPLAKDIGNPLGRTIPASQAMSTFRKRWLQHDHRLAMPAEMGNLAAPLLLLAMGPILWQPPTSAKCAIGWVKSLITPLHSMATSN